MKTRSAPWPGAKRTNATWPIPISAFGSSSGVVGTVGPGTGALIGAFDSLVPKLLSGAGIFCASKATIQRRAIESQESTCRSAEWKLSDRTGGPLEVTTASGVVVLLSA